MQKNTQDLQISQTQAARIALKAQGLLGQKFNKGKRGVLQVIQQLSYVQIDTISVAQRAHHHTIWTRIPDYHNDMIWDLLSKDKTVFEYWSHAAAFLPMEDFRYSLWMKKQIQAMEKHWHERDPKVRAYVLDRIKAEGPLQSKDFENPKKGNKPIWFTWKPAKIALGQLFFEGQLMVSTRKGFQKVFDLTERILPEHINTSDPSAEEMADYLIKSTLKAHGLASLAEINYLRRGLKASIKRRIEELTENGDLIQLNIKGLDSDSYYAYSGDIRKNSLRIVNKKLHFLNPFDNSVIQRNRLRNFFNFEFQIEVYVPQAKRKHGYYSLPILWGDEFAGRIDVKAERKSKTLLIQHLWKEGNFKDQSEQFMEAFKLGLLELMNFNGCESIKLIHCGDPQWKRIIQSWGF